jgi:hypothetical protein
MKLFPFILKCQFRRCVACVDRFGRFVRSVLELAIERCARAFLVADATEAH